VDLPKGTVHKFDIKRALADIEAVDRGDVTEIMSIQPHIRSAGRSTPVLSGTGSSRQTGSEQRSSSTRVSVTRRASAVDDRQSPSTRNVHKMSELSKSSEELDGIFTFDREEASNHMMRALPENSMRVESTLDEAVKRTSASEENLLSEHRLHDVTDIKQLARLQEESKSCLS